MYRALGSTKILTKHILLAWRRRDRIYAQDDGSCVVSLCSAKGVASSRPSVAHIGSLVEESHSRSREHLP